MGAIGVNGTNVVLPIGLLADGATLHHSNGNPLDVDLTADSTSIANAIGANSDVVLDARNMGESSVWWAQTFEMVSQRLGIDMKKQTIAVHPRVATTIGGIATDEHGRAVTGKWSRWFTGLYAAGDSLVLAFMEQVWSQSNRLLDAMAGGAAAGEHAANYAAKTSHTGRGAIEMALGAAEADLDFDMAAAEDGPVQRSGPLFSKLADIMQSNVGYERNSQGLESALESLEDLKRMLQASYTLMILGDYSTQIYSKHLD